MKTYDEINAKIEKKQAVVMTAEEIIGYVERKGLAEAAREVDVVTTATFGAMCSSGCFLNFGHAKPRIRMTQAWIDDVEAYCGIAAVDVYLGATQLRRNDPANLYYPGEFRYGGGHAIERLVAGERLELHALSIETKESLNVTKSFAALVQPPDLGSQLASVWYLGYFGAIALLVIVAFFLLKRVSAQAKRPVEVGALAKGKAAAKGGELPYAVKKGALRWP